VIENETFFEDVRRVRCVDISGYVASGAPVRDRIEERHTLSRLRFSAARMAVETQFLATLHARITAIWADEFGELTFTVSGFGRDGEPFSFDILEKHYWQPRRFLSALHNAAGAGTFVMPGRVAATIRAIYQLSQQEEPDNV
jgi:hypothetical protein